ncbi:MAG: rhodanese-like domain-containing protein [Thermodesulfobacteriota bacterium]
MKQILYFISILALLTFGLPACAKELPESAPVVSGFLKDGLRVIPIQPVDRDVELTVYRGDYIQFQFDPSLGTPLLSIPGLSIRQVLPADANAAPYFKMTETGTFGFTLGPVKGALTVIPYQETHYREVSAEQAAEFIKTSRPLVLDVRTPPEYALGHLPDSVHIPLNQLEARHTELSAHKDKPVLIYCATGNRSTVAAKILIDKGFQDVSNMRQGIVDWSRKQYPVVK